MWVLEFELAVLQFVRSFRTCYLELYVQCMVQLLQWFFSLHNVNYAHVHVREFSMLETNNPSIFLHFWADGFTARKTKRAFSAIFLDQANKLRNAHVKGDGSAVGLTSYPSALRR